MNKETEDFYIRLKSELEESTTWPAVYLYKFIVPTNATNVNTVENAFNNMGAVIKTHASKTGKYTSLSINVLMESPESVVEKYIEVSNIEGIISL